MIKIFVTLIVMGVLLWLVNAYIPMDAKIKQIVNILAVVLIVIWLIKVLGLMDYMAI